MSNQLSEQAPVFSLQEVMGIIRTINDGTTGRDNKSYLSAELHKLKESKEHQKNNNNQTMSNTILDSLSHRIVSFRISENRKYVVVSEECDGHFKRTLEKPQLQKLIGELQALADTMEPEGPGEIKTWNNGFTRSLEGDFVFDKSKWRSFYADKLLCVTQRNPNEQESNDQGK